MDSTGSSRSAANRTDRDKPNRLQSRPVQEEPVEDKVALSRERKRMWRKNLPSEKLEKLREKDAARKRVERGKLAVEKKRAIKKEPSRRTEAGNVWLDDKQGESSRRVHRSFDSNDPPADSPQRNIDESNDREKERSAEGHYRKVSVQSLLN